MDSRIAVVCVVLAVFAVDQTVGAPQKDAVAISGPAYTTKYDHIDVDQVLASKRLVNSYVQCLLDKKPCTPEGAELRSMYTYYTFIVDENNYIVTLLDIISSPFSMIPNTLLVG
jgi:hypothetical protein